MTIHRMHPADCIDDTLWGRLYGSRGYLFHRYREGTGNTYCGAQLHINRTVEGAPTKDVFPEARACRHCEKSRDSERRESIHPKMTP